MLSLYLLSFVVQGKIIFHNISLSLLPSSIVYLSGKNGSGKTSLLRMLAGIQKPTQGSISYDKRNILISRLKKPYCTYIGHKIGLKQELSVIDNLNYWAQVYNSKTLVESSIIYFQLQEYRNTKCYQLSIGNQKKLGLAKLMTCKSSLWLLDEVDTNLDQDNKTLLINLIISHSANGGIVFISSHSKLDVKATLTMNMSDYSQNNDENDITA